MKLTDEDCRFGDDNASVMPVGNPNKGSQKAADSSHLGEAEANFAKILTHISLLGMWIVVKMTLDVSAKAYC